MSGGNAALITSKGAMRKTMRFGISSLSAKANGTTTALNFVISSLTVRAIGATRIRSGSTICFNTEKTERLSEILNGGQSMADGRNGVTRIRSGRRSSLSAKANGTMIALIFVISSLTV